MLFYQKDEVKALCLQYGTSFSGSKQASRCLTHSYRHPLIFLSKDHCFIKIDDLFLNMADILHIQPKEKSWLIHSKDNTNLLIDCSFNLIRAWARFCALKQLL